MPREAAFEQRNTWVKDGDGTWIPTIKTNLILSMPKLLSEKIEGVLCTQSLCTVGRCCFIDIGVHQILKSQSSSKNQLETTAHIIKQALSFEM